MMRNLLVSAALLAAFAVTSTGLVVFTHTATAERIAAAERQVLVQKLHALVPPTRHDNDLLADRIEVRDPELLGTAAPVSVYRARVGGKPAALILTVVAPDGYSGEIQLLVAVNADGSVAGVRVTAHRETPGLGDRIEVERSDWITRFDGRSLTDPAGDGWAVKKDGGVFDQFTGATITPRAVVNAVRNALRFVERHHTELFATAPPRALEARHE